jgi:hypothetical protein
MLTLLRSTQEKVVLALETTTPEGCCPKMVTRSLAEKSVLSRHGMEDREKSEVSQFHEMREYEWIAAAHEHIALFELLEHNHLKHYQKSMPNAEYTVAKLVIDTIFCEDPKDAATMGHYRDREDEGVDIYAREAPADNLDMAEELRKYIALLHQSGKSTGDSAEKIKFQ